MYVTFRAAQQPRCRIFLIQWWTVASRRP